MKVLAAKAGAFGFFCRSTRADGHQNGHSAAPVRNRICPD